MNPWVQWKMANCIWKVTILLEIHPFLTSMIMGGSVDIKNGHIVKVESPFPRPIIFGILSLVYRGVAQVARWPVFHKLLGPNSWPNYPPNMEPQVLGIPNGIQIFWAPRWMSNHIFIASLFSWANYTQKKRTWTLKMMVSNRDLLFLGSIFRHQVSFQEVQSEIRIFLALLLISE